MLTILIITINFIGNSDMYRENKKIQSTPKKLCEGSKDKNRTPNILGKNMKIYVYIQIFFCFGIEWNSVLF